MMSMRLRLGLKKESIKNVELVLTSDYGVFMSTSRMSLNVFGFFTGEPTALELVVYRHPSLFNKLGFQYTKVFLFCFLWRCSPTRAMASPFLRFLDHTQRRITVFFFVALRPNAGHGLPILEVSRSHTTTHHSR